MEHRSTETRRDEITAALLRTMAIHGYERATIAKIAAEAGLAPGLLHYHFANKQQILLALLDQLLGQALADLVSPAVDPPRQLAAIVDRFLATGATAQPEAVAAWVVIAAEAIRQPEVAAQFSRGLESLAQTMTMVIERGTATGDFRPSRPVPEVIGAFLAMVQGYFTLAATAREIVPTHSAAPAARTLLGALLGTELP